MSFWSSRTSQTLNRDLMKTFHIRSWAGDIILTIFAKAIAYRVSCQRLFSKYDFKRKLVLNRGVTGSLGETTLGQGELGEPKKYPHPLQDPFGAHQPHLPCHPELSAQTLPPPPFRFHSTSPVVTSMQKPYWTNNMVIGVCGHWIMCIRVLFNFFCWGEGVN